MHDSLHSWDWKEIPLWMLCGQLLCHGEPGEAIFFRLENSRKDNRWSSSSFRHYQCKERIWVFGDFSCVCLCVCFLSWPLSFYETGGLKGNGKGWNSDGESQRNAKRRMMKWQSPVKSTKGTYMIDMSATTVPLDPYLSYAHLNKCTLFHLSPIAKKLSN